MLVKNYRNYPVKHGVGVKWPLTIFCTFLLFRANFLGTLHSKLNNQMSVPLGSKIACVCRMYNAGFLNCGVWLVQTWQLFVWSWHVQWRNNVIGFDFLGTFCAPTYISGLQFHLLIAHDSFLELRGIVFRATKPQPTNKQMLPILWPAKNLTFYALWETL